VALNVYYCKRHNTESSVSLKVAYFAVKNLVCYSINNLLQTQTDSEISKAGQSVRNLFVKKNYFDEVFLPIIPKKTLVKKSYKRDYYFCNRIAVIK
jgi:hypothetical protein